MTEPVKNNLRTETRMEVRPGMTIKDIKENGSTGQKLTASLFDCNQDGVFDDWETSLFNSCNFSVKDKSLTIYDRESEHITEIKFNDKKDLDKLFDCGAGIIRQGQKSGQPNVFYSNIFSDKGGKTTIDLAKGTIDVNGVTTETLTTNSNKLSVKNSNIGEINALDKAIELTNVKDKGVLWDSSTTLNKENMQQLR